MNNTTHTPGPWRVIEGHCGDLLGLMSETGAIAMLGKKAAINPANAQLIAAAPDLLEALREMGDCLAYGLDKPDGSEPTAEDLARAESVAAKGRAAIDKSIKGLV